MDITKSCRDVSELTERAQQACNMFMDKCKAKGLNVLITETYRSQERQNYLYEQGRTRAGKKVTWTKQSRHTSRRSWDICKNVKGHEYDDPNFFKECGEIAAELGITWGGVWKSSPDTPHFEITKDWKEPAGDKNLEDTVLDISVRSIIKDKHIALTYNCWKRLDLINLNNVPALVCKLAKFKIDGSVSDQQYKQAVDKLVLEGYISQRVIWDNRRYTKNNVRALIVKFAKSV